MNRHILLSVGLSASLAAAMATVGPSVLRSSSPPDDRCGAPPTYSTCNQCHTGTDLNAGGGALVLNGIPEVYTPGQTYIIDVELSDPTASRWGFEVAALDEAGNGAGSALSTNGEVQVSASAGIEYVKTTSAGTSTGTTGSKTWSYEWTAPASSAGTVRFYAAGNAANGSFSSSGDKIYTAASASAASAAEDASLTLQPSQTRVFAGMDWNVEARVREHTNSANDVLIVSRILLPNGNTFPNQGFLLPPVQANLIPAGQLDFTLTHSIPVTAPALSAVYQGFLGRAPNTLVNSDSFAFTIQ